MSKLVDTTARTLIYTATKNCQLAIEIDISYLVL